MSNGGWNKPIPERSDRLQSRTLVGVVGTLLMLCSLDLLMRAVLVAMAYPAFVLGAFAVSIGFALAVVGLRAATAGGAACGGMICLLVSYWSGWESRSILHSGLTPLMLLFLLTFVATRAGRQRKATAGLAEARRGRSAAQVIANLSVAGLSVTPIVGAMGWRIAALGVVPGAEIGEMLRAMCLAALVEATADTVSSEIGQAFGGQPRMLTTMRRVAPGTDGAVTVLGTCAGVVGGAMVAAAGLWGLHLTGRVAWIALGAGVCGLFFDSAVGATLERRGWLGNDLVNFASTAFAAALAALGCRLLVR